MTTDLEFWRQDPATKAEDIAKEIERLARRAGATGLSVTTYILQLAVEEARKEAGTGTGKSPSIHPSLPFTFLMAGADGAPNKSPPYRGVQRVANDF
jgi:hypothetical protein